MGAAIDPTTQSSITVSQALGTRALGLGILNYKWPINLGDAAELRRTLDEIGDDVDLPAEPNGRYHYVIVTDDHGNQFPALLPDGPFFWGFVAALGAKAGEAVLRELTVEDGQFPWLKAPRPAAGGQPATGANP